MRSILFFCLFVLPFGSIGQSPIGFINFHKVSHHFKYDSLRTLINESGNNFEHYLKHLQEETERHLAHSPTCIFGDPDSSLLEKHIHEYDSVLNRVIWLYDSALISFESQTDQYMDELNQQLTLDSDRFCNQFGCTKLYWEPDLIDSIQQLEPIQDLTYDFLEFLNTHSE